LAAAPALFPIYLPCQFFSEQQISQTPEAFIELPALHDFRRAFALKMLRSGVNVYALQKMMGHSDLQVLRGYLAQTEADLRNDYEGKSPVDNW
jgi:site-specific recombinase XerD